MHDTYKTYYNPQNSFFSNSTSSQKSFLQRLTISRYSISTQYGQFRKSSQYEKMSIDSLMTKLKIRRVRIDFSELSFEG